MNPTDEVWRSPEIRRSIIEWDVGTWSHALRFWDQVAGDLRSKVGLEVGGRNGGLSTYLALKGCRVVCSDLSGPTEAAVHNHRRLGLDAMISYACADVCSLPFADRSFDLVVAKSVLGAVGGGREDLSAQRQAVSEICRVLRPGGVFLFAENMSGTRLHHALRCRFVPWGGRWHYFTEADIRILLSGFAESRVTYHGFLALLGRREWQRTLLHFLDTLVSPAIPSSARYMACGVAAK